jgi:hypothetical protein
MRNGNNQQLFVAKRQDGDGLSAIPSSHSANADCPNISTKAAMGIALKQDAVMTSTFATSVTVGTAYGSVGNGYPFMINAIGGTLDYEQIYSSTAFSGPITFNTITFFDTQIPGSVVLSGNYDITFSYTSSPLGSDYPVAGTGTQTFFDGVLGGANNWHKLFNLRHAFRL